MGNTGTQDKGSDMAAVWKILRTGETLNDVESLVDYNPNGWRGGLSSATVLFLEAEKDTNEFPSSTWSADKTWFIGDVITEDSRVWICIRAKGLTGTVEPTWNHADPSHEYNLEDNQNTYEHSIFWEYAGISGVWAPEALPDYQGIVKDGSVWLVVESGTSGALEPDWSSAPNPGDVIYDGTTALARCPGGIWEAETEFSVLNIGGSQFTLYPMIYTTIGEEIVYFRGRPTGRFGLSGEIEPDWSGSEVVSDGDLIWIDHNVYEDGPYQPRSRSPRLVSLALPTKVTDGRVLTIHVTGGGDSPSGLKIGLPEDYVYGQRYFHRNPPANSEYFETTSIGAGKSATYIWDNQKKIWHLISKS